MIESQRKRDRRRGDECVCLKRWMDETLNKCEVKAGRWRRGGGHMDGGREASRNFNVHSHMHIKVSSPYSRFPASPLTCDGVAAVSCEVPLHTALTVVLQTCDTLMHRH